MCCLSSSVSSYNLSSSSIIDLPSALGLTSAAGAAGGDPASDIVFYCGFLSVYNAEGGFWVALIVVVERKGKTCVDQALVCGRVSLYIHCPI